ncbi:MAG: hypothetical protein R2800_00330 [Flavipsychrobacter sp.]
MKHIPPLFITTIILLAIGACKHQTNITPVTTQNITTANAIPPIEYAKKHTSRMKGMRSWTCYYSGYGNWEPNQGGTRTDTSQQNMEVIVLNDSTVFLSRDTLTFIPEQTSGFGGTIYKTDTSYRLLYSIHIGFRHERMLYYYYKNDSVTYYSSYTANGGGYKILCHTN